MFRKTREKSPYFLIAMDFGYTLLASILVFGFIGWYVDHRYNTVPWFMVLGGALGLAVGFNSLFRKLNLLEQRQKAARKKKPPEDQPPGR